MTLFIVSQAQASVLRTTRYLDANATQDDCNMVWAGFETRSSMFTKPTLLGSWEDWRYLQLMGSGCVSVGRVVACYTRGGPRFASSHRQYFTHNICFLLTVEKTKMNKKRPGMSHF